MLLQFKKIALFQNNMWFLNALHLNFLYFVCSNIIALRKTAGASHWLNVRLFWRCRDCVFWTASRNGRLCGTTMKFAIWLVNADLLNPVSCTSQLLPPVFGMQSYSFWKTFRLFYVLFWWITYRNDPLQAAVKRYRITIPDYSHTGLRFIPDRRSGYTRPWQSGTYHRGLGSDMKINPIRFPCRVTG